MENINIDKTNLVVKHNALINATSDYKFSRNELKMICILISNINNKNDTNFKEQHINIRDLDVNNEETNNHTYISNLCKSIMSKPFKINGSIYNWFTKLTPLENEGIIEYQFHEDLKTFLLELKDNFTKYHINDILKLRSSYSIQVFELLTQYKVIGNRTISMKEFREVLSIPSKYRNPDIKRLLETIQKDLKENSNIDFNFSFTKLGRVFHEINFNVKDNYKKNNNKQNLKLSEKMKILRIDDL